MEKFKNKITSILAQKFRNLGMSSAVAWHWRIVLSVFLLVVVLVISYIYTVYDSVRRKEFTVPIPDSAKIFNEKDQKSLNEIVSKYVKREETVKSIEKYYPALVDPSR
ncbi:MAG: hypothetical protein WCJ59_02585 [bacterium]